MAEIIGKTDIPFEISVKKFYIPAIVIKDQCPKCGKECIHKMCDNYLYYPQAHSPETLDMSCRGEGGCGHEWTVPVVVKVSLELCP